VRFLDATGLIDPIATTLQSDPAHHE